MLQLLDNFALFLLTCGTMNALSRTYIFFLLLATACLLPGTVRAEEEETLDLFSGWQEQSVSAGRAPKPLSHTPENVTVVTAADIEAINAHTLADVLATIPGLQLDLKGGPGSVAFTFIQGSQYNHVLVLVDGVPLNNLTDNFSDVGLVPVQQIERIEIVKGAASAAWGQALGGVINVITKNPERDRIISGTASGALGERGFADARGEVSGTKGPLGYYLSSGFLGSAGLTSHTALSSSNAYAKLVLDLPGQSSLTSSFSYTRADRGEFSIPSFLHSDDATRYLYATLGYRRSLAEGLDLELNGRHTTRRVDIAMVLDNGTPFRQTNGREEVTGASAKMIWRTSHNLLVAGGDYEHADMSNSEALLQVDLLKRTVDRWGVYLNHTLTQGPVSISSGARFDRTQSGGDQFSPSLGFTWQISDNTLARGYTARGYSLPSLTLDRKAEKVWTSQVGIETSAVPQLWIKGTLFRNDTWDVPGTVSQTERHLAMGGELETRTAPVMHTSVGAGYTFVDTIRTSDGSQVKDVPRHTLQLALRYDDARLRGALTGRHIWWNADPAHNGRYYGLLWDLHLGATLLKRETTALELFFSGRNLFNNRQYLDEFFRTPGRWFEGGMRVRF